MAQDYEIQYKRGNENVVAVALSRSRGDEEQAEVYAITTVRLAWLKEVSTIYTLDSKSTQLLQELVVDASELPNYNYEQGIIRYKGRVFAQGSSHLRGKLIGGMHDSLLGGHSGNQGTYQRLKSLFYWP
ncbi:hypothetical protein ACH5RR_029718 [Cinchona calisaya]|uniref:Integrase zinc-binding domain-containing protein n=1 Tax=Cinchona calisaya TaxID=153742 RepID=A0ABD2YWU8_9GENT